MIQIYGPVPVYKKKIEHKPNCICDNSICNKEFYRSPSQIAGAKHNYCSIRCMDEGREIFIFSGTITLFKDGRRLGTARFHSKEQLKELMELMYSLGKFETYFGIKFNSNPKVERNVATEV